jgi:mannose-6-phosphate isomerase-like protein (cupin superfamily)
MEKVNEKEKEFRGGDSGPKYLFRGPRLEWGVLKIKNGGTLGRHWHERTEETFYFIEGTPQMEIDGKVYQVEKGDAFRIEPGEKHNIINQTGQTITAIFIKCPYNPGDKIMAEK